MVARVLSTAGSRRGQPWLFTGQTCHRGKPWISPGQTLDFTGAVTDQRAAIPTTPLRQWRGWDSAAVTATVKSQPRSWSDPGARCRSGASRQAGNRGPRRAPLRAADPAPLRPGGGRPAVARHVQHLGRGRTSWSARSAGWLPVQVADSDPQGRSAARRGR
jgi:hypothetical protein